ncbi:CPBP family intramembrane glutamic endopeptidase [Amycolatopsis sp. H20-H5]|uniref:CPBP family intramembrane glutamic endopeptidase n=1 Tax=Amycolatopsis sp. H20-H5 TaxID=3046309 RepID=UPI002DBA7AE6|nr:type II CAAX endopeptidase family protein [Amycolatopsis sp. H20-H5]MEC3976813.1 type II CAAX endopeptidase family protein [Amycolatopsis sp. H20-H5]
MSRTSHDDQQETAKTRPAPEGRVRPGWTEIVVAAVVYVVIVFLVVALIEGLDLAPATLGLIEGALSAVAALGAFAVAVALRIRSWSALGAGRVSWRWLLVGLGAGVLAVVLSRLVAVAFVAITGITANPQDGYNSAATAGPLALALSMVLIAVATPIGEELLFRGLLTTALMRYGAVVAVVGSAAIFAFAHGINTILPIAFVIGLINAELRRRSGSVWPGVVVHIVNNVVTNLIFVALAGTS